MCSSCQISDFRMPLRFGSKALGILFGESLEETLQGLCTVPVLEGFSQALRPLVLALTWLSLCKNPPHHAVRHKLKNAWPSPLLWIMEWGSPAETVNAKTRPSVLFLVLPHRIHFRIYYQVLTWAVHYDFRFLSSLFLPFRNHYNFCTVARK